ncbi:MAG: VOC family protein [Burkholderiales bacterium]|nr:VOC family protein [Nitrosomonadaceae bacterium]
MAQHVAALALLVRDYDEAIAWYTQVLGFELLEDTPLDEPGKLGKRWVRVRPPGAQETALLLARAVDEDEFASIGNQSGGRVFLFLHTDDFWGDYKAYSARGVRWLREPVTQPYGTVAVFADLYGNAWDLIGPAAA